MSDQPTPNPVVSASRFRPFAELVHALRFLTRLPVPFARTLDLPPLHQTMRMFSVAGAIVGLLIAGVLIAGKFLLLPPFMAALLAVAFGLLLTGALHEDGLADSADGLGGGKTIERRLEIMRDSRIGSYGTLALIIATGLRVTAFAEFIDLAPLAIVGIMVACQSFSRGLVVDLMWATRPARSEGLSAYAGQPSRATTMFAVAIGIGFTLLAGSLTSYENAILALGLGLASTALVRWFAVRLIGGQTGDICGAAQVLCEVVMLAAFTASFH